MSTKTFDLIYDRFTHPREGGYVNDPRDPGGETNHGICKRDFPELDIKALTPAQAKEIYFANYWSSTVNPAAASWQASQCDKLSALLAMAHFDCAVNIGNKKRLAQGPDKGAWIWTGKANQILQRALGVEDDGYIGPVTLKAAEAADVLGAANAAIDQRIVYYHALTWARDKYLKGWLNRCALLREFIGKHAP